MVEHVTIEEVFVGTVLAPGSIGIGIETGAITLFYTPIPAITNSFAIRVCSSNDIGRIAGYIKFFGVTHDTHLDRRHYKDMLKD